jgi:PKD repeat protein
LFFSGCSNDSPTGYIPPDPVASFSWTGQTVATAVITFQNTSKNALSYRWEFGDGDTSTATSPSKTYASGGTYTIRLTANNSATSKSSLATQQIAISNFPGLFSLPTTVGTRWTYHYLYDAKFNNGDHTENRVGTWVWEITSVSSQRDSIICTVQSTAVDSCHNVNVTWAPIGVSDFVDTVRSSWSLVTTPTNITVDWDKMTRSPGMAGTNRSIARSTVADTFRSGPVVAYVRNVGLISYANGRWTNAFNCEESLTLISRYIK